eukprot:9324351-Pyramimonas_sp.AAC.1
MPSKGNEGGKGNRRGRGPAWSRSRGRPPAGAQVAKSERPLAPQKRDSKSVEICASYNEAAGRKGE